MKPGVTQPIQIERLLNLRSHSVKDHASQYRINSENASELFGVNNNKQYSESSEKAFAPTSIYKSRLRVPYRHSGARQSKGVLNALSLTRNSHKPISITDQLVASLKNTLDKGYCINSGCERPAYDQRLCKHHFASIIKKKL